MWDCQLELFNCNHMLLCHGDVHTLLSVNLIQDCCCSKSFVA